ncbi:porin family protein [Pontibacter beigongshangensis]|uniref:porin family protein n=1 Tax=Pontibacter beigongshangensis TaxID=2574733 RepID=UPI00165030B4|nr:porin family protein [Pontibacter beigongshangensis]
MKKIAILIALVLGFTAPDVFAQQQPVRFGIKAGLNLANWQGESVKSANNLMDFTNGAVSQQMREGFHAGAFVSIPIAPGFEIEPGLQYSQKGTRLTGTLPFEMADRLNVRATVTNKAEYLDLPVLAKVYVGEGFHLFAGPQVSYLLSNKIQVRAGALGINVLNQEWDMKSGMREIDFAMTGGVGYRFSNGFNMSAGYDFGLSPIDNAAAFKTYNSVIKASIGFAF